MDKRRIGNRTIKPHLWIFCEGEPERNYIELLRQQYRIPMKAITKIMGSSINSNNIKKSKQNEPQHEKDKTYLIYDGDKAEIIKRIEKIDDVDLIVSNPCIELWFLLHKRQFNQHKDCKDIVNLVKKEISKDYKKGNIDKHLKIILCHQENRRNACERAKSLTTENPSTNFYILIDFLEQNSKIIEKK